MEGGMGQDLGYLKIGIFPGDARIFSLTLAASPDDDLLRSVLRTRGFEAAAAALPITRAWVDPAVSEPISDVHGMANLRNTRRWLVADGEPLALGVVAIGDALIHTNPITGRGCSLAWVSAFLLAEALRKEPEDARALALVLDAAIEREVVPWWRAQVQQDRDAIEVEAIQPRGENPVPGRARGRLAGPEGLHALAPARGARSRAARGHHRAARVHARVQPARRARGSDAPARA